MARTQFKSIFFIAEFFIFPILVFGQYYNLGQDPASVKWRQITTPHFNIIYPENFDPAAHKMTPTLDFIYLQGAKTLAFSPSSIPLIMHTYNIVPNAVTAWAPKRVEMFTCPPQDSYAQDWLDQLMIHEYRHVVQLDRANQGFTRVLSWFTGQQAAALVNGLYVPRWFMEGDAVCTETALSHSGRGRIPSFEMLLRTQVQQKGAYSYDKATMGSFNTFVPDQYVLGYSLVANVRRRYSYQAWITALDEVARKPFIITPLNNGLKKATGYRKEQLYRLTMLDMDSMWKYQDSQTPKTQFTQLTAINTSKYENFKYPFYLNDTMVVAEYSSMDDITRFVLVGPDGGKEIIATPGFLSTEIYSIVNTSAHEIVELQGTKRKFKNHLLLAWTENISDPRWEQRNFSVIKIYDCNTGKTRELTRGSRYFAPAFSPDGQSLAAVVTDPAGRNSIVLIDANSGHETDTIIFSDNDFFMTPSWSGDGKQLVFTKLDCNGKSICIFDMINRNLAIAVPATFIEISNPVFAGGYLLFNGSYSGIENIYAVNLQNNVILQVTSAAFGASNAHRSPDGRKIIYSNYVSNGFTLVETGFKPGSWKQLSEVTDFSASLYKYLVAEEKGIVDSTMPEGEVYQSKPYKKISHIFNFHSWAPAYINYMENENGAGVSFMSQNDLSTATAVIGYKYDMAENTGKVTLNFSWQAWYPMIDFNTSYGARAAYTGGDTSVRYNFNETTISGGLTLPLTFTGGKYYKGLRLRVHTTWNDITNNTSPLEDKLTGTIHLLDYSVYAYRAIKQSYKDLYPRWGQAFIAMYRHTPFGDNNLGSIVSAGSRLYFPGAFKHHGIRVDVNWQQRNEGTYPYSNLIELPRGYKYVYQQTLTCFAVNYKFPFAYPDFSIGPFAYIKRLKANLFFDGGIGTSHGESQKLRSTGAEITSNLHFLRLAFPVDIGVRIGYLPIEKQFFNNFLFSVNLPQ
jgi:Tol biopolymer transport system component